MSTSSSIRKSSRHSRAQTIEVRCGGYAYRGTLAHVGTFEIVAIDINHPNVGYYTEFMAFWRSPHLQEWQSLPVHNGSRDLREPEDLLEEFPQFAPLFAGERDADYYRWLFDASA